MAYIAYKPLHQMNDFHKRLHESFTVSEVTISADWITAYRQATTIHVSWNELEEDTDKSFSNVAQQQHKLGVCVCVCVCNC